MDLKLTDLEPIAKTWLDLDLHYEGKDKMWAAIKANEENQVVGFFIDGQLCFVERLADYDARLASLKGGTVRRLTAVLIGDVGNCPTSTLEEFWSWFPFQLFSALSFASGAEVGLPWIEIRDEEGGLIRRLHGRPGLPHFWEGDALLGQFTRAGTRGAMGDWLWCPCCKASVSLMQTSWTDSSRPSRARTAYGIGRRFSQTIAALQSMRDTWTSRRSTILTMLQEYATT